MQIYVSKLNGDRFSLQAQPSWTISTVKTRIREIEEIPINQQRIIFRGNQLQDRHTVQHYEIQENSTIHLVIQDPGF